MTPLQYDLVAGFDFGSVSTVTKEQLMQAINQIYPLSNVSLALCFSSANGTLWPSIVNNPRFKRYIWIDTYYSPPRVKVHNQTNDDLFASWINIDGSSLTNVNLTDNTVSKEKFLLSEATARQVLRKNVANDAFEYVSPVNLFSNGEIPLATLAGDTAFATSVAILLRENDANQTRRWRPLTFSDIEGQLVGSQVPSLELPVSSLEDVSVEEFQDANNHPPLLYCDPADRNWKPRWPSEFLSTWTLPAGTVGDGSGYKPTITHNLNYIPQLYRVFLQVVVAEHDYNLNDLIPIECFAYESSSAITQPICTIYGTTTQFHFQFNTQLTGTKYRTISRATGLPVFLTPASWKVKVLVWA